MGAAIPEKYRQLALTFALVTEKTHFHKAAFLVKGKIFLTIDPVTSEASLKLSSVDQSIYCQLDPGNIRPANGMWGKQGWTMYKLSKVKSRLISESIKKSYALVATKYVKSKVTSAVDDSATIQTLHPDTTKKNKKISLEKYTVIRDALLKILSRSEMTHTDLMERLYHTVKDTFEGGVQWYGEVVKLDLEARGIIERTPGRHVKYRLREKNR